MEDHPDAPCRPARRGRVRHVPLDHLHRRVEVVDGTTGLCEEPDVRPLGEELAGHRRPDEAGPAGHEDLVPGPDPGRARRLSPGSGLGRLV